MRQVRRRFWLESVLAGSAIVILTLTIAWRDWIEAMFGVDPDHHSGSLEWLVVALSLALVLSCSSLARYELRRASRYANGVLSHE